MTTRRALLAGAALAAASCALRVPALGQGASVTKLVVGFPPGGITDSIARLVAQGLGETLGRSIVVENRAGAGGNLASAQVAKSEPDGATLLLGAVSTHAINPQLYKGLTFDSIKDFAPIAFVVSSANVLVAHPQFPPKSVAELVAYARGRSEPVQMAVPGFGTTPHMAGELLKRAAGIELAFVPYKGGGPALIDVMGGVLPIMFEGTLTAAPHVRSGAVRALGIGSPRRSSVLPDVPAIAETLPGYDVQAWWGVFAPSGLAPELTGRLHDAVMRAVRLPGIASKLTELGCEI
jgi:tripartite-type tricarboxylate transporter receptor subunit TctC